MWRVEVLMLKMSYVQGGILDSKSKMYIIFSFSSRLNRIKFNTQEFEWSRCMDTCPKYNRAMVPSFTNKEELEELLQWVADIAIDPASGAVYSDAYTPSIWIPFRCDSSFLNSIFYTFLKFK